ncbi:MAG: SDR family NAD(P)-dependent oxidoreductase [Gemmataceae bacterium]
MALVGMGCLFPKAGDVSRYWSNIGRGVDAITDVPAGHWKPEEYLDPDPKAPDRVYVARGGFLDPVNFAPLEYGIAPNTLEATDTTQLLGMLVAKEALADAGYGPGRDFDRNRTSVILGVTSTLELVVPLGARLGHPRWRKALAEAGVDPQTAEEVVQRIADSYVGWQEDSFPGLLGNVAAGRIANRLDLGGTNCVVDAACASSLGAVHLAMMELAAGRTDMVLTGGLDTFNDIFMYMCFSKTPALSPTGNSRPFDAQGDGTILGEGLGVVVLKRLADAERDGNRIYALLRSIGTSSDGKGNAIYAPSPAGQAKALRQAYRLADVTPETIELVEAHGTGTKAGDAAELTALIDVYRSTANGQPRSRWCALGSVKSQIGHTKAAAGVAGLIKASLALYHKVLPPTIKVRQPLPSAEQADCPFYINAEERPWLPAGTHPRRAALSSFGFGGSNFHCVLEEHAARKPAIDWDGDVQLVAFSANSRDELARKLEAWPVPTSWPELRAAAADTRKGFQHDAAFRLVAALERDGDAGRVRSSAQAALAKQADKKSWSTPERVFFGSGSPAGKLACLFPGQGSQYPGMLRELACRFPQLQECLAGAGAAFASAGRRLGDFIYPPSVFSEQARQAQADALRATDIAQPALGAVSLGAWRVLEEFGLRADAAAGHSYGELVALCAAGCIEPQNLWRLSIERGRLMAGCAGDTGGMLAVRARIADVETLLRDEHLDLVIANKNAPEQCVLSGRREELARAAALCEQRGVAARPLTVSAAFHSPLVAGVREPFGRAVAGVPFAAGNIPVYANSTGLPYPHDPQSSQAILAEQLAQPVEFVQLVENMYRAGVTTFVEVGPGAVLTGLIRAILGERPHEAMALDAGAGKKRGTLDLAAVLAVLAASGRPIALDRWDASFVRPQVGGKPTLTIPLTGANYVKPRPERPPSVKKPAAVKVEPTNVPPPAAPVKLEAKMDRVHSPSVPPAAAPVVVREVSMTEPNRMLPANEAVRVSQENLAALQRFGEQTAQLHRQFLDGQDRLLGAMQSLLEQQQRLLNGQPVSQPAPALPAPVRAAPAHGHPAAAALSVAAAIQVQGADAPRSSEPVAASTRGQGTDAPRSPQTARQPAEAPRIETPQSPAAVVLLGIVAEKTGYPVEMLELDMELDSDLGIDSIKRVEILSAVQESLPEAPAIKSEHLGTLRTLRQVADFLAPASVGRPHASAVPQTNEAAARGTLDQRAEAARSPAAATLLDIVSSKTGYPVEMLELDMELDSDLGIDSIKRVEIFSAVQEKLPGAPAVKSEHLGTLRTLRQVVDFLAPTSEGHLPPGPQTNEAAPRSAPNQGADLSESPAVREILLDIVSTKTGYPVEMLELDMELDSDLGIDSIKRVEIFSAVQEKLPEAPPVKSEHLGTLRTLRQVVDFLGNAAAPMQAPMPVVPDTPPLRESATPTPVSVAPVASSLQRQAVVTVPVADGRSPLNLPAGEIWITDDGSGLSASLAARLDALGQRARVVPLAAARALHVPADLVGLVVLAPVQSSDAILKDALFLVQHVGPALRRHGLALLATVARLDGHFGLRANDGNPLAGGLAGLAKTAAHEWPEVACKAIDLAAAFDDDEAALMLADELFVSGPIEVGLARERRSTLHMQHEASAQVALPIQAGEVILATGGARGVTAEALAALAQACRPTLVILGRTPLPDLEPDWLAAATDEAGIKQALLARAATRPTPRELDEQTRRVLAHREVQRNLERMRAAGAKVLYRAVDVRDRDAVARLLAEVHAQHGPLRGIVHGAGVLADRLIADKTEEQFERVYGTKVDGLRALLEATANEDLAFLALFSSTTARLGRSGQVDYAMANEVLNKLAQYEARRRPACRVVSINWGPWAGGMVNPALGDLFAREGVGLIPLADGAHQLVRELQTPAGSAVEVVVLARPASEAAPARNGSASSTESVATNGALKGTRLETLVDVDRVPILRSHVLDGRAVLPMALMMEWLAHAALHGNPGLVFHGLDELRVLKGLRLDPAAHKRVRVVAGKAQKRDGHWLVPAELHSSDERGRERLHARTHVVLGSGAMGTAPEPVRLNVSAATRSVADLYASILFHGPELQGIESLTGHGPEGIVVQAAAAPAPSVWLRQPWRSSWLTDPLAVDVALQAIIVWGFEHRGALSLPCAAGRYRQYRKSFPTQGVRVQVSIARTHGAHIHANVDWLDEASQLVARLEDCEFIADSTLEQAFRNNKLPEVAV